MSDIEPSDADLLRTLRSGPDAIGLLYRRHAPAIHRYLARRTGVATADDLLGDVFVAALTGTGHVTPHRSGSALPWLYGVAANVVRTHRRRARHREQLPDDSVMDWDAVDERIDALAQRDALRAALAALPDHERELLLLVAWEGLSPVEAAAALGVSRVAARSRLHRARVHARQALAEFDDPAQPPTLSILAHEET